MMLAYSFWLGNMENQHLEILKNGGIGVMPTDTIYGVVGQALNPQTVERLYAVRRRRPDKPFIVLIGSIDDLKRFGVQTTEAENKILKTYWPGQVSIILPCPEPKLDYLHRGTNSIAFRLPNKPELLAVLHQTGPLAAPSANPEGLPSAKSIIEAREYFHDLVDFYEDAGPLESEASALIRLENGEVKVLRPGGGISQS